MDYLEGALLHSWWSDTDYESRRHTGTWLWYSLLFSAFLAYSALLLNIRGTMGPADNNSLFFTGTLVLFFVTPLFCLVYYKLPFILRLPILFFLGLKYVFFFLYCIGRLAPFLLVPDYVNVDSVLAWGNETFGMFLEETSAKLGVTGLFVGGGIVVLIGIGLALAVLALVIFVPIILLKAFNAFQFLWDKLVVFLIGKIKSTAEAYKKSQEAGKFEDRAEKRGNLSSRNT